LSAIMRCTAVKYTWLRISNIEKRILL
jgi:hypothetical protein